MVLKVNKMEDKLSIVNVMVFIFSELKTIMSKFSKKKNHIRAIFLQNRMSIKFFDISSIPYHERSLEWLQIRNDVCNIMLPLYAFKYAIAKLEFSKIRDYQVEDIIAKDAELYCDYIKEYYRCNNRNKILLSSTPVAFISAFKNNEYIRRTVSTIIEKNC